MQPALPTCSEGMAGPAKTWGLQPSWCRAVTQRKQANRPNRDYRSPCQREETALLHTLFFFRVTFFFFFFFATPHGTQGFSSGSAACNAGDAGLIPGLGRFPGGGQGNPLQ